MGSDTAMRRYPYTDAGIKRVPCARCGKPSVDQWNICALGNGYYGVCKECDEQLNELVLRFFRFKDWRTVLKKYKERT